MNEIIVAQQSLSRVNFVVIAVIALYVLGIMAIGWWSSRRVSSMDDFLVAGRKLPFWMASATLLATWFGAGSSMGVAGAVYSDGAYAVVADPFGAAISLILGGLFYVSLLRRMRLLTVTDIVERCYGTKAGIYTSLWMIPVYIGWLGVQIMGIGKLLELLFGVDTYLGSFVGAAIILFYTIAGGMWAVTLTDIVQVTLIICGLSLIMPGAIGQCGGLSELINQIPAEDLTLLPPERDYHSMVSYIGQWVVMGFGCIVGQDLIQRSLASKTPKVAGNSAITAGVGYLLIGVIPITIGFCGRYIDWMPMISEHFIEDGKLIDPEQVIPLMAVQILPTWLLALFLSALVSAIMSSADSSLLAACSLLTNNVIRPCKPQISQKKLLLTTRVLTVIVLVISLFLALNVERMFSLLVNSWASQLLVIFIPVTTALYFPKVGVRAVWSSMIAGPAVWMTYAGVMCAKSSAALMATGDFVPTLSNFQGYFDVSLIEDDMLYCGAMYGFVAAVLAVVIVALISPRKSSEPEMFVPRRDEDVPQVVEEAAAEDEIELPPILS